MSRRIRRRNCTILKKRSFEDIQLLDTVVQNSEWEDGKIERAVKHFTIAANLGHDGSLEALKQCYKDGIVSKDDFAAALRAHHAAVKATKSPEREVGEKFQSFRMNFVY